MDAVGHVADRNLPLRPAREQSGEQSAADLAMHLTDTIDPRTATDRQPCHVEGFAGVGRILPSEAEQFGPRHAQLADVVVEVLTVLLDLSRREGVEPGRHGGVRREHVAGACGPQRLSKRRPVFMHEMTGSLDHQQRGVAFIQMADLDVQSERVDQPPSAHAENDFLQQANLRVAAVQRGRQSAVRRCVERIVAVEQIQGRPADYDLPGAQQDGAARKHQRDADLVTICRRHRLHGKRRGLVEWIELGLATGGVEHLTEVSLLPENANSEHGDMEVARGLQKIAGEDAEAPRVQRQCLVKTELHAEVRHAWDGRFPGGPPGSRRTILLARFLQRLDVTQERGIGGQPPQPLDWYVLQQKPWVLRAIPQRLIQSFPHRVAGVVPCPVHVEGQCRQPPQRLRKRTGHGVSR